MDKQSQCNQDSSDSPRSFRQAYSNLSREWNTSIRPIFAFVTRKSFGRTNVYEFRMFIVVLAVVATTIFSIYSIFKGDSTLASKEWLEFWGSFLGGLFTLVAFVLSVFFQKNESFEAMKRESLLKSNEILNYKIKITHQNKSKIIAVCDRIQSFHNSVLNADFEYQTDDDPLDPAIWEYDESAPYLVGLIYELEDLIQYPPLREKVKGVNGEIIYKIHDAHSVGSVLALELTQMGMDLVLVVLLDINDLLEKLR